MATKIFEGSLADAQKLDLVKSIPTANDALRKNLKTLLNDKNLQTWLVKAIEKDADFKSKAEMSPDGKNIVWGATKTKAAVGEVGKKFKLKLTYDNDANTATVEFCGQKANTAGGKK
jgi:hypothetical protein